jgi:signal transduction histidine kinase
MTTAPRVATLAILTALWTTCAGVIPAASQALRQKKILVLYSTRRDTQMSAQGDRTFPEILRLGLGTAPDLYSEYLDAARFPDAHYNDAFRQYLQLKYKNVRFDLAIVVNHLGVEMLSPIRDGLFHDVPIVFFSEDSDTPRLPNSTGVISEPDYAGSVAFAQSLQPDTSQVFVIAGTSGRDRIAEAHARAQFDAMQNGLAVTYLSDLTTDALEQRIRSLPPHSVLFYVLFYQDAAGTNVNPLEYLDRLAAIANRPMYSWVDSTIGRGVVGGSVVSIDAEIRATAAVAVRVLRGEKPDAIAIQRADLSVKTVDSRQLVRWNISDEQLPAGTVIQFRTPSPFQRYKRFFFIALVLVAAQAALIIGLLAQRARRRKAESEARARESELRSSYDRIRDLGRRLIAAQDVERARVARDLHDDVGQQLTLLALDVETLASSEAADPKRPALSREATQRMHALMKSVHDVSHSLHPGRLRLVGLIPALATLCREMPAGQGTIQFSHEHVPADMSMDVSLCLYRIAQEALQNAVKYAGARRISVRLSGGNGHVALAVEDDGQGFDVDAVSRGLGLISMRERLELLDGHLQIRSTPGVGSCIDAVIPVADASRAEANTGDSAAAPQVRKRG